MSDLLEHHTRQFGSSMKDILDPKKLSAGAGLPASGPEGSRPGHGHATTKWQVSASFLRMQSSWCDHNMSTPHARPLTCLSCLHDVEIAFTVFYFLWSHCLHKLCLPCDTRLSMLACSVGGCSHMHDMPDERSKRLLHTWQLFNFASCLACI